MLKISINRGLTLIELMVVVAITAIVLTIGIPSFKEMIDKNRLRGAAETLYADLQYARSAAIKRNRDIVVQFEEGASWCYGIDDDDVDACDCDATPSNCTVESAERVIDSGNFIGVSMDRSFGGGSDKSGFNSVRGLSSNAGTVALTAGSNTVCIVISRLGRIRICSSDLWNYENCPDLSITACNT